jgi:tetratricopeptide (TPR) repeat protein
VTHLRLHAILGAVVVGTLFVASCTAEAPAPPPAAVEPPTPRAQLDLALRHASERNYDAAIKGFEAVRSGTPDDVTALDGLKMVVVYTEVGERAKSDELTNWLVDRYREPKSVTDAERSVKGYLVHSGPHDKALITHAVAMTRYASQNAAAQNQGEYQGFFDTSLGIAEFRAGRFAEAARSLAKATSHQSVYVRSLALTFHAMAELRRGNRPAAEKLLEDARRTVASMPIEGTDEYGVEWTDVLISRRALEEAERTFDAK